MEHTGILPPYADPALQPGLLPQTAQLAMVNEVNGLSVQHDGTLTLYGQPIKHCTLAANPSQLLCTLHEGGHATVSARDLFTAAIAGGHIQQDQQDLWLTAYIRARAALSEVLTLYAVTSVSSVLNGIKGSDDFLEALDHARATLPRFPTQFDDEVALFAACICLGQLLKTMSDDFQRGTVASCLPYVRGGRVFLEAFLQVQEALIQLPLLQSACQVQQESTRPGKQQPSQAVSSVEEDLFVDQYRLHQDEILRDKDSRRALVIKTLEIAGVFLSIGIANIAGTGAVDLAYSLLSFFLAAEWRRDNDKIGLNRRFIRNQVESHYHKYQGWENYCVLIHKLSRRIWKVQKQQKRAPFKQLLASIEPEIRSMLKLAPDEPLPQDVVIELEYAYQTPPNLLTLATRGIFLATQLLTLIVGIISVVARVIETPTAVTSWALVGVAVIFLVVDSWAIMRTWCLIRNLR
jgi:hypothetical protein